MKTLLQPFFGRASSRTQSGKKMSRRQHNADNTPVDDYVRPDKAAPPEPAAEVRRSGTVQRPPAWEQPHSRSRPPVAVTLPGNATPSRPDDLPSLGDSDMKTPTSGGTSLKDLTRAAPPRSSSDSTPSHVRRAASQLPTVVDEGYEEGPPAPSCSWPRVAPPSEDNSGQNVQNPAAATVAKKTSKLSWFRSTTTTTDAMAGAATLRHKPSFRDRFWSASSSNDFGDSAKSSGSSPTPASASAPPPKRAPYVPRHAASDFARTTNSRTLHHRQSASWDGGNNYTLRPPPPPIDEESPFADSHETSTLYDTSSPPLQRLSSRPAPPPGRNSTTEADKRLSSDYEQFLANAAAEERAQRVQAARRSWRNGGEGSRHDSAYYSAGGRRGDSARTSEDGSGASLGQHIPRTSPEAIMEAKRQSRAAQKIVEYIKPPREDIRGSVRVE